MSKVIIQQGLTKHSLWLREGDMDFLKSYFPSKASKICRKLVSNFVDETKREMEAGTHSVVETEAQMGIDDV